jgi:hypothetical protein
MNMTIELAQRDFDPDEQDEQRAENMLQALQRLDPHADVIRNISCCGRSYYEWFLSDQQGTGLTFVDAVRAMYSYWLKNSVAH